jgi:U3 small nucleolar RNA-associated protein 20
MGQTTSIDPAAFWSKLEQHEKDRFLKAFDLINAKKGISIFMPSSLTSSACEDNSQLDVKSTQYTLVSLLLKKIGKIALQTDAIQVGTRSHCIYVF